MKSHAHGLVVGALDREVLHLLRSSLAARHGKDRHARGGGPVPGRQRVHHPATGLQVDHARVPILRLQIHDLRPGLQIDFDEVVDADIGHEAGAGGLGHGGPAGGLLVIELGHRDGLGEVGEIQRRGAEGRVGRQHVVGSWYRGGAEKDGGACGGGLCVRGAHGAILDGEDGDEAGEGLGGVHGVALYGGDEGAGVFVEEGDADAVGGADRGVGLFEVEGAEGVELRDSGRRVKFGAGDAGCGAGVADADGFEAVGGGDGGRELWGHWMSVM